MLKDKNAAKMPPKSQKTKELTREALRRLAKKRGLPWKEAKAAK